MKKVFLTLALVAFGFAANAQWIIGGNIGFNTDGGKSASNIGATNEYNSPIDNATTLDIAPTISYSINDKMWVGLWLDYRVDTRTEFNGLAYAAGKEAYTKTTINYMGIAPYFRYYFANAGKFNFFCEAELWFDWTLRTKTYRYDNTGIGNPLNETLKGNMKQSEFGINITPGVNYRFNEHFSADLYIDIAGISFCHEHNTYYNNPIDREKVTETRKHNTFGLNANAAEQSLNAHLNNFRIGFNYHF